jgi:hypothetical protein
MVILLPVCSLYGTGYGTRTVRHLTDDSERERLLRRVLWTGRGTVVSRVSARS